MLLSFFSLLCWLELLLNWGLIPHFGLGGVRLAILLRPNQMTKYGNNGYLTFTAPWLKFSLVSAHYMLAGVHIVKAIVSKLKVDCRQMCHKSHPGLKFTMICDKFVDLNFFFNTTALYKLWGNYFHSRFIPLNMCKNRIKVILKDLKSLIVDRNAYTFYFFIEDFIFLNKIIMICVSLNFCSWNVTRNCQEKMV